MKGFRRTPESQQLIRHQAKQLGVHGFYCNLSEAITDIVSHHIDRSLMPDGEESHTSSVSTGKAVLRTWQHQRCHSRRESHSSHNGSASDVESRGSDDSEHSTRRIPIKQRAGSCLSSGIRHYKSISSVPSPDLQTIAQSPPENQIPCDGLPAKMMSHDNSQLIVRRNDNERLRFGSQPTVSIANMHMYTFLYLLLYIWLFYFLYSDTQLAIV